MNLIRSVNDAPYRVIFGKHPKLIYELSVVSDVLNKKELELLEKNVKQGRDKEKRESRMESIKARRFTKLLVTNLNCLPCQSFRCRSLQMFFVLFILCCKSPFQEIHKNSTFLNKFNELV